MKPRTPLFLAFVALLGLPAALTAGQEAEKVKEVPVEKRRKACSSIEEAVTEDAETKVAIRALRSASQVVHSDVVKAIDEHGMRHADLEIRAAAIRALGRMDDPTAIEALHAATKRDEKLLEKEHRLHAELLKEIGRHGDPASIPYLVEDTFQSADKEVVTARIMALGRIRSKKSVDELIGFMRSVRRSRVNDHMGEFRVALTALTGTDCGTTPEPWINWYGDAKRGLEITPEMKPLTGALKRYWYTYWGEAEEKPEKDGRRRGRDRRRKN